MKRIFQVFMLVRLVTTPNRPTELGGSVKPPSFVHEQGALYNRSENTHY